MSVLYPLPADRWDALARAKAALSAERNPAVLRTWIRLFDAARSGQDERWPFLAPDLVRDARHMELLLLIGAQARA